MNGETSDARSAARRHEEGLARFLQPHRRGRFVTGLAAGGFARQKVLDRLPHFSDLDPRWSRPAPNGAGWDEVDLVADALVEVPGDRYLLVRDGVG